MANLKEELEGLEETLEDLGDELSAHERLFGSMKQHAKDTNKEIKLSADGIFSFNNILRRAVLDVKKLPGYISSAAQLEKEMVKSAKVFSAVESYIIGLAKQHIEDLREQGASEEKILSIKQQVNSDIEEGLKLLKRQQEYLDQSKARFFDINKLAKQFGEYLYNPSTAIEAIVGKLSAFPVKVFEEAAKGGMKLGTVLKEGVGGALKVIQSSASLLFSPLGLLIAGVAGALAPIILLFKGFKDVYEHLDKNVIPATVEFNKQIGGSGVAVSQLKLQMNAMGQQFLHLGRDFSEGASLVRDFALGMRDVSFASDSKTLKETLYVGTRLIGVLGLSGEEAGKLALQFRKSSVGLAGLNKMMKIGADAAGSYGVPVSQVQQDMAKSPEILARFGAANLSEFSKSTALANRYGFSIKTLNGAFGKNLDSFEGSAEAAAKLNAVFGTNIDSMKLMLEQDPTKRFEMIRTALIQQGKDWGKLTVQQKNVITSTTGLSQEEAALGFSLDRGMEKLKRQLKQKQIDADFNKTWENGLIGVKKTVTALGPAIDRISRALADFVTHLFGGQDAGNAMISTSRKIESAVISIAKAIENATSKIDKWKDLWDSIFNQDRWSKAIEIAYDLKKANANILQGVGSQDDAKKILDRLEQDSEVKSMVLRNMRLSGATSDQIQGTLSRVGLQAGPGGLDFSQIKFNSPGQIKAIETNRVPQATVSPAGRMQPIESVAIKQDIQAAKKYAQEAAMKVSKAIDFKNDKDININLYIDGEKIGTSLVKKSAIQ